MYEDEIEKKFMSIFARPDVSGDLFKELADLRDLVAAQLRYAEDAAWEARMGEDA